MERRNLAQKTPHARETMYLVDEGAYNYQGEVRNSRSFVQDKVRSFRGVVQSLDNLFSINLSSLIPEQPDFPFGRMFKKTEFPLVSNDALIALGKAMVDPEQDSPPEASEPSENSNIPSGHTFLGQFIAHDISFDEMGEIFPLGLLKLTEVRSKRSPTLELDSLYGRFPGKNDQDIFDSDLYRDDRLRFKLGETKKDQDHPKEKFGMENDLPREDRIAIIADERNDENLGIAQMHVAFLRFHNAVIDHLKNNNLVAEDKLFETAREIVIKHYQGVILDDFLKHIVDKDILSEVIEWAKKNDAKLDWLKGKNAFIPVEFSVAGFRFGHSILQNAYDWNEVFKLPSPDGNGTFERLSVFTGPRRATKKGRMDGFDNLLGTWAIDWRRFFDFSKFGIQTVKLNTSRKIDPQIAHVFTQLQQFILMNPHIPVSQHNLASRNLVRGNALSLPTGEEVVAQFDPDKLNGKRILTKNETTGGPHEIILKTCDFQGRTPLWYYILKEAEVIGGGNRLGTIGSYIVAETLVKLIQISGISVFDGKWNSQFSFINGKNPLDGVEMADLIKFADSATQPLINPLGLT